MSPGCRAARIQAYQPVVIDDIFGFYKAKGGQNAIYPSRKAGRPTARPPDQELTDVSLFAASIPYEFYGSTDPGRARDNNEDSIAFDEIGRAHV